MARTWFITGASRGLGAEIVRAAVRAGDQVIAGLFNRSRGERGTLQGDQT
jgi:NAD(P)-dependent dehydrogenase (short-subunit alcohol dehydrogenase family)